MDAVLLKTSHEDLFLQQGYYLALQFHLGWVVTRITGREWANLRPFSVGAVPAGGTLGAWNQLLGPSGVRYLEAPQDAFIYHSFWGINTPNARVYVQFPTMGDIGSLTEIIRAVAGDVGFITGDSSPFLGPFSTRTELFTVHERYPAFQVANVTGDAFANVIFNVSVMKYTYQLIKDKNLIARLLVGDQRCRKYTMGRISPSPTAAPKWLQDSASEALIRWTQTLMESEGLFEVERGGGIRREDAERAAVHFNVPVAQVTSAMIAALPARTTGLVTGRARR